MSYTFITERYEIGASKDVSLAEVRGYLALLVRAGYPSRGVDTLFDTFEFRFLNDADFDEDLESLMDSLGPSFLCALGYPAGSPVGFLGAFGGRHGPRPPACCWPQSEPINAT